MNKIKISLLALGFMLNFNQAFGQIQNANSNQLGRLINLQYDLEIYDRLYAHTETSHIMISQDNGESWNIAHGFGDRLISHFQLLNDNKHIYVAHRSNTDYKISIFNTQSGVIIKDIYPPYESGSYDASIRTLDFFDINTIAIGVVYKIGDMPQGKIYTSNDGGDTWNEIYHTLNHEYTIFDEIKFSPDNSEIIYAGLSNGPTDIIGGLMITRDSGQTWEKKLDNIQIKSIEVNPFNTNEIWAGSGINSINTDGVFKSTDGGETWEILPFEWMPLNQNVVTDIKINPNNPNHIIILEENEYFVSLDGGETWEHSYNPNPDIFIEEYYYGTNISFNPFNANEILINSDNFALKSENFGSSYNRMYLPYFNAGGNVNVVKDENGNRFLYYGYQLGLAIENMDTGEVNLIDTLPINKMRLQPNAYVVVDLNNSGRFFTLSTNDHSEDGYVMVKVSNDGGQTIHEISNNMGRTELNAIGTIEGNTNKVIVSMSLLGEQANLVEIDYTDINNPVLTELNLPNLEGFRITYIYIDPLNENNLTISQGARIYKSSDKGQSWTQISSGLEDLVDFVEDWDYETLLDLITNVTKNPMDENVLYMSSTKGVYKSNDNGLNWNKLYNQFTNKIHVSDKTNGHLIAGSYYGTGPNVNSQLHISSDDGQTWRTVELFENFYIQTSHFLTSSDVEFFDTYAHVYISTSGFGIARYVVDFESLTIGEPEFISNKSLTIFPNPSSDFIHLKSEEKIKTVEIYSITGQLMHKGNKEKINVSSFSPGVYILKSILENGQSASKKFIKK